MSKRVVSIGYEDRDAAVWRTPIADRISRRGQEGSRSARLSDKAGYIALISHDKDNLPTDDDIVNDYYYSAWMRTTGRCLFRCGEGYIGLASSEIRAGDYACVLSGADVPFIVRRDSREDYCVLVGEAYMHGVMNGEFMRSERILGPLYIR